MNSTSNLGSPDAVSLAIRYLASTQIDIFRNAVWAGSGCVKEGRIVDCYAAQLGKDGSETEQIYEAIEHAIATGQSQLRWSDNGRLNFTWQLSAESLA